MAGRRPLTQDLLFWALIAGVLAAGALSLWPRLTVRFAPAQLVVSPYREARVSLNRASLSELEALPGVGPELARRIIAHRPYLRVEDLLRVPGIGPQTLKRLRPYVAP